jgi:hypothetical protein
MFTASPKTGVFFFYIDSKDTTPTARCGGNSHRYALNPESDSAKAAIAIVLSAKATGQPVYVYGSGICDFQGDTETPLGVQSPPAK